MPNVRFWKKPAAIFAIVTILLTGCATEGFDDRSTLVCLPIVEYSREEQRQVAEEVKGLPEGGTIVEWLTYYSVLMAQVKECVNL